MHRSAAVQKADPFGLDDWSEAAPVDISALFSASMALAETSAADTCGCGGDLRCGIGGLRRTCEQCGVVVAGDSTEPDDDAARPAPGAARLKLVGVGSGSLQPDLYRSSSGDGVAAQKRQVLEEFRAYRQQYIEDGGIALPLDACTIATHDYNEVQRQCVKRSQNKRRIMAACYKRACLKLGLVVPNADIARCMKLPNSGIASGMNVLRALEADGKLTVDADASPWKYIHAEITTLCMHIGLGGPEFAPVHDAVFEVVRTAVEKRIGTMSVPRTKVAGAAYSVLRRAALSEHTALSPESHRTAVATVSGGLQAFCGARIRKNTVERFLTELTDFHSHFEPIYTRHNIDARPSVDQKADIEKPDEAKPRDSKTRVAKPRVAKPHDAKPHDAKLHDAKPRQAKPRQAKPRIAKPLMQTADLQNSM